MRQPVWDVYETAILIDAYYNMRSGKMTQKEAIKSVSKALRKRAQTRGIKIDSTFRNENGIKMRLAELLYIDSNASKGLRNTAKIFRETMKLYRKNKEEFDSILCTAKAQINAKTKGDNKTHSSRVDTNSDAKRMVDKKTEIDEAQFDYYLTSLNTIVENLSSVFTVNQSYDHFSDPENEYHDMLYKAYYDQKDVLWIYFIFSKRTRYISLETEPDFLQDLDINSIECSYIKTRSAHPHLKIVFTELNNIVEVVKELFNSIINHFSTTKVPTIPAEQTCLQIESQEPALDKKVVTILKESKDGITKAEICKEFNNYSTYQINKALEAAHAVLVLNKFYHRDSISDYYEMADILLDVLNQQFNRNDGYTSALLLYKEARAKLDDFFFYNGAFDSRQEVFDLAVHLFSQEKYKGNSFIFMNNKHIWKEEPPYPKDFHGLLIKYAREHNNTFTKDEAIDYFESIGSENAAPAFSYVLLNTGNQSFLQYSENTFVLTESLGMSENKLNIIKDQLDILLDGEDYIATGEIDDYFFSTLPSLPSGISWSILLLEDILRIFDIGYEAIEAGEENDKKTFPAAIIRKNTQYRTFADVVWNEIFKEYGIPKEFSASDFRVFLLEKGFIRRTEKMWSAHKTVAGDIRFLWTENNRKVTIN